jgi:hypothetical protein
LYFLRFDERALLTTASCRRSAKFFFANIADTVESNEFVAAVDIVDKHNDEAEYLPSLLFIVKYFIIKHLLYKANGLL